MRGDQQTRYCVLFVAGGGGPKRQVLHYIINVWLHSQELVDLVTDFLQSVSYFIDTWTGSLTGATPLSQWWNSWEAFTHPQLDEPDSVLCALN